ncbi:tail assembly protein [Paracoccus sp. MKU1]|uniref:tail assembly protein n=1 Tax=Paracoccus sp. MKU1 TaxID=1745182 RepID=UPI00071913FC|nr:tail assembly protein [Paracoccus sp. MKU1]
MQQVATASPAIRGVKLYGRLKKEFGETFPVVAENAARALHIMEANFIGRFLTAIREGEFFVWIEEECGKRKKKHPITDESGFLSTVTSGVLHIAPRGKGSSRRKGGLMALLGAVLVGAALIFSGGMAAGGLQSAFGAMQGTFWGTVAQLGVGMMLSGIGMMLSPMPGMEETDDSQSYTFSGATNTMTEGGAIPVIYGEPFVGSTVISAGISIETLKGGA